MANSNKRYKITIVETSEEETLTSRRWVEGGTEGSGEGRTGYGYTPQIPQTVKVEREIYTQQTDDLNLVSVINAINEVKT
ncbi:MAG: hypothetical protein KAU21_19630 [Gammaproteobacteria bacterium]|nr:hypothetical protein [Gammaproteobacteria bacterium]